MSWAVPNLGKSLGTRRFPQGSSCFLVPENLSATRSSVMTHPSGPVPDPHNKTRRRFGRRGAAAVVGATLVLTGVGAATAATQVTEKNPGGLIAVGPVSGDNGFPAWYEDASHTRVELCLDDTNPLCGFLPGDIPDPNSAITFPDNFPQEAFYALASSDLALPGGGKATLTLGLEAAFANAVQKGDQQVFGRQRIVIKGGPANSSLTVKEPYGTITVDTDASGAGKLVEDISPAAGNFTTPLKGNVGPFLHWDSGAPAGYLGDPAQTHTVTGRTIRNTFSVTGGGLELNTDQFSVQGKISTNSGVNADAAVVNGNMLDVFASSSNSAQLQVEGTGLQTTPMVTDPDSGRFYARIALNGAAPSSVKVVNIADKPASNSLVDVSRPSGITVTQASYDGTNLTVAANAPSYPVHVVGMGDLTDNQPKTFSVSAPGGTVTVKNDIGSASLPVTVTGGSGMPAALPPTPVTPDPGPVVDTGTGGTGGTTTPPAPATTTTAVASIAQASLSRGLSTTLDGSASTNGGTGALTYAWSQVSGPAVTISDPKVAKPTVSVPFFTSTAATKPAATDGVNPAVLRLTVTDSTGTSKTADVSLTVVDDNVVIAAGARHRLNNELRITGTATLPGNTAVLVPGSSVVIWDVSSATPVKLGTAPVDTLNAFDLRQKPGPSRQVTKVLVQSTRGGSATSNVA